MKVISFKICPFVQRVIDLLEAMELKYEVEFIRLREPPSWFPEISPHSEVPVLITDGGRALFESEAIVEYLEEVYPSRPSGVSAEEKAWNRAWGHLAAKNYLGRGCCGETPGGQSPKCDCCPE